MTQTTDSLPRIQTTASPRVRGLRCRECGVHYPIQAQSACEQCFGPLEVSYDYDVIRAQVDRASIERGPASLWRYQALLPMDNAHVVDTHSGFTPLVRAENLGRRMGLRNLWLKNDTVNPTFSFKDRPVSVASSKALHELGFDTLACASTGNLAGSVAAHAAKAGVRAVVFIPADLEPSKIVGASIYHPLIVAVNGTYDDVNRLCSEVADNWPWAFVNINLRPFYAEGSKTLAFEVAEQLGWRLPDRVVVPLASASMFTKIHKGFEELQLVGLVAPGIVRMVGAQAEGCSPIVQAYREGSTTIRPVRPNTIAKSLAIGNPADGYYALRIVAETKGALAAVPDPEIVQGIKLLAETEGIFSETAGGVTIGALARLASAGEIDPDELVVAYITGSGFKTIEAVADTVAAPIAIPPTISAFERDVLPQIDRAESGQ